MELTIKHSSMNESTLIWAVTASVLLHILLVVVMPKFQFDAIKKVPDILSVELQKPAPPAPLPELAKPEPPKVAPEKKVIEPKPVAKPITKKVEAPSTVKETPQKQVELTPMPAVEPPTKVIAVESKTDVKPQEIAPLPVEKPKISEASPNSDEFSSAKSRYMDEILKELKRNHRYPKIAENRGLQGVAKVEVRLDNEGGIVSATVVESSGSNILDEGALATVRRSNFKQYMKDILKSRIDTITVPVSFIINPT